LIYRRWTKSKTLQIITLHRQNSLDCTQFIKFVAHLKPCSGTPVAEHWATQCVLCCFAYLSAKMVLCCRHQSHVSRPRRTADNTPRRVGNYFCSYFVKYSRFLYCVKCKASRDMHLM
jgi:hypothetical protein